MILLNSTQIAEFVSQGVLIFPSVIDKDINTKFLSLFDLDQDSKDLNKTQAAPIYNEFDKKLKSLLTNSDYKKKYYRGIDHINSIKKQCKT